MLPNDHKTKWKKNGRKPTNLVKINELICHFIMLHLVPLPPVKYIKALVHVLAQKNSNYSLIFAMIWLLHFIANSFCCLLIFWTNQKLYCISCNESILGYVILNTDSQNVFPYKGSLWIYLLHILNALTDLRFVLHSKHVHMASFSF